MDKVVRLWYGGVRQEVIMTQRRRHGDAFKTPVVAEGYKRVLNRSHGLGVVDDKGQNRFLVSNLNRDLRVQAKRAAITFDGKFSSSTFRKRYRETMANNGVAVKTLQYPPGHFEETTTLTHYTQLDTSQADPLRDVADPRQSQAN